MDGFALWTGLGASLGLWRITTGLSPHTSLQRARGGLWVLLGVLAGARAVYVALEPAYYTARPWEVLQFWLGGLAWPGAMLGGLAALAGLAAVEHSSLAKTADQYAPLAAPLAVGVYLGCWQSGAGYGVLAPAGVHWGAPAYDEYGLWALRFPLQFLCALVLAAYFALLEFGRLPIRKPGQKASLAGLGLSLDLLLFSWLRADPVMHWQGLAVDVWAAMFFCLCSGLSVLVAWLPTREPYRDPAGEL
ncbi:MAG: hypothetical protein GYA17_21495 [Chloroflexi bacterium]|nr:hypothetical protein [Chloroflexota bacterium]